MFCRKWNELIEKRRKDLSSKRFSELCEWANQLDYYVPKEKTWREKPASEKITDATKATGVAVGGLFYVIAVIIALAVMARIMYAGF